LIFIVPDDDCRRGGWLSWRMMIIVTIRSHRSRWWFFPGDDHRLGRCHRSGSSWLCDIHSLNVMVHGSSGRLTPFSSHYPLCYRMISVIPG
jgi:hypothetical protein